MSKRIEELEKEIEFVKREKKEYIRLWELEAKLEERKLAEKDFLDKINEQMEKQKDIDHGMANYSLRELKKEVLGE